MPQFYVDIEKRLGSEFWTNRYIVYEDDLQLARAVGEAIVQVERSFHSGAVTFTRLRTSTTDPNDDIYSIITINETGQRVASGSLLPLFNTLRVEFNAASGRPSRKYYRGVLTEADIDGSAMTTDFSGEATALEGVFATLTQNGIVDPQGQLFTSATIHPFVQMRQLRRGKRRKQGIGVFP